MFKIFSKVAEALPAATDTDDAPGWLRDPLAHPALEAMDARALGDLPFGLFRPPSPPEALPRACRNA